ncbi:MAG: Bug family tripartite tricarboxylate transporter substrate binding protein [Lautropia sp.]
MKIHKWMSAAAIAVVVAIGTLTAPVSVRANSYPAKAVKIIVPYSAGGIADILARRVGVQFERNFTQPFVVENRTGANGTIAQQAVAQSTPDGYTLLLGNIGTQVVNRFTFSKLAFDIEKSFQPIGLIGSSPMLLVTAADSPINTVADLLNAAKGRASALTMGTAGNASAAHLCMALLTKLSGTPFTAVPYRGASQIIPDLIAGRVVAFFDTPMTAMPLIQGGKIKPIAVTGTKRLSVMPDVPTVAETVSGFEYTTWLGLFAPRGTPADRVDTLNSALAVALENPEMRSFLIGTGSEIVPMTPNQFDLFIENESVRIGALIRSSDIRLED